jgi:N-acetyl-alpha-D-glucosaminyl L-malate synthase BshA
MKPHLEIALVFYPTPGGSGVIASELAAGLVRRGHRVHVIASASPSRALPQDERLSFHRVATQAYPLFEQPPYALAVAEAIIDVSLRHKLDLVHVHYAIPHAASAYLARQALGELAPRIITTMHGTDVTDVGTQDGFRRVTRFTVAASDGLTVLSAFLRDEARQLLQLPAERPIEVIANFVDTDRFAPAPHRDRSCFDEFFANDGTEQDGPVLFHVSNLRPVKRPADLIDVLARIRTRLPARLVVVGDGPEREDVEQRAHELNVTDSVHMLGSLIDFVDLLKHADVFVLPSASESFGVAALEALSTGVPVCAYRVGGLPDLVSDGVGRLVRPFDLEALAAAVIDVVSDQERREQMGAAARAMVLEKFPLEPAIDRYEEFYRRVLDG